MGDIKRDRKKYQKPGHPWQKERIEEEKILVKEYGLANKKEIWKHNSLLRDFTTQAKTLVTKSGEQAEKEKEQLLNKLKAYGYVRPEGGIDEVLAITLRDILERRLQTQVHKKMLANTVKQARQFITHKHVKVDNKTITSPSYMVSVKDEALISFREKSALSDEEHPERTAKRKAVEKEAKEKIVKPVEKKQSAEKKPAVEKKQPVEKKRGR